MTTDNQNQNQNPDISDAVKLLLARMESNPDDLDKYWSAFWQPLIDGGGPYRSVVPINQMPKTPYLNQDEKRLIAEAHRKILHDRAHKALMKAILVKKK